MRRVGSFLLAGTVAWDAVRSVTAEAPADACGGVKVYVYDNLPQPFDDVADRTELLEVPLDLSRNRTADMAFGVPCTRDAATTCTFLKESGFGPEFSKHSIGSDLSAKGLHFHDVCQNALPWIFATYLKRYCAVSDPAEADLFFVTFPVISLLRASLAKKITRARMDEYHEEVKTHLARQPAWQRCGGCDHLLAIPKPIQDLNEKLIHRIGGYSNDDPFWARTIRLSHHANDLRGGPDMEGVAQSALDFHINVVAMPWPLSFMPESDEELEKFMDFVFDPQQNERAPGAILAAGGRAHRKVIVEKCKEPGSLCHAQQAQGRPLYVDRYRKYTYSVQPGGDTPTRRGFFESLIAGTVPIVFNPDIPVAGRADGLLEPANHHYRHAYSNFFEQAGWGEDWLDQVALVATDEADAMRLILETPPERVAELQANIRRIVPMMLFWDASANATPSKLRGQGVVPTVLRLILDDLRERKYTSQAYSGRASVYSEIQD